MRLLELCALFFVLMLTLIVSEGDSESGKFKTNPITRYSFIISCEYTYIFRMVIYYFITVECTFDLECPTGYWCVSFRCRSKSLLVTVTKV